MPKILIDKQKASQLYDMGVSMKDISEVFGVSQKTLRQALYRMGFRYEVGSRLKDNCKYIELAKFSKDNSVEDTCAAFGVKKKTVYNARVRFSRNKRLNLI